MAVSHEFILAALTQVDSGQGGSIVAKGWVGDVIARDGHVLVTLDVPPELGRTLEPVRDAAEKAVHKLAGVMSVTVVLTADDAGAKLKSAQSCSVPEDQAKLAAEPTPMDEFISAVKLVADQNPDGLAHLAALGHRQNFPGKLSELARILAPLLADLGTQSIKSKT